MARTARAIPTTTIEFRIFIALSPCLLVSLRRQKDTLCFRLMEISLTYPPSMKKDGVFLDVGSQQNFTCIAAIQTRLAFISSEIRCSRVAFTDPARNLSVQTGKPQKWNPNTHRDSHLRDARPGTCD